MQEGKMDIVIREIEEQDYPEVTALLVHDLWDNRFGGENVIPFFNKAKDNPSYRTFIALLNGHVVGIISTMTMFWATTDSLFIQAFVVKREYQNKGIGKKLLKHAEDYAKANGITGTGLQSGLQRTAAHAFYERNGYIRSNYFYKNF